MTSLIDTNQQDPQIDPNKNYVEELVGDGKKFKTVEELARGKWESDQFIAHKNREYDTLREDYLKLREQVDTGQSLKDLIDQMKNQREDLGRSTELANQQESKPFDPEQIKSLVSSQIEERERARTHEQNFNQVRDKLVERYGSNHSSILKKQIEDMGMSVQDLDAWARTSPKAVIRALGLDQPQQTQSFDAPPRSSQRSSINPDGGKKRTWNYYENLRKTDPRLYSDPKTQTQMFEDRRMLGESFMDGNYKY